MRSDPRVARKSAGDNSLPVGKAEALQARSTQNRAITTPPIGTSARFGLTWLRRADIIDPAATPIAKTSRQLVMTCSVPPTTFLIRGGSSERATAPASQNHETMIVPSQRRFSAMRSFSREIVEVQGLRVIVRCGAP
jgi:hypothetical protein